MRSRFSGFSLEKTRATLLSWRGIRATFHPQNAEDLKVYGHDTEDDDSGSDDETLTQRSNLYVSWIRSDVRKFLAPIESPSRKFDHVVAPSPNSTSYI